MRERVSNASEDALNVGYDYTTFFGSYANPWGTPTVQALGATTVVPWSSYAVMHDVVTPNWNKIRKQGAIVNNPMDRTLTVTTNKKCHIDFSCCWSNLSGTPPVRVYNGYSVVGSIPSSECRSWYSVGYLPVPTLNAESLKDQAIHKAWANQDLTEVQGLVIAAELGESIASLTSAYRAAVKLLKKAKRTHGLALVKEFSASKLSEKWMYARYALRPLIYDVIQTLDALVSKTKAVGERMTSRGHCSETETSTDIYEFDSATGGAIDDRWHVEFDRTSKIDVEVRAGVLSAIEQVSKVNTWGLDQPFEAIWELVPLSFVVDWFFDVGTTIAALTPEFGLKALASWSMVTTTSYQEWKYRSSHRELVVSSPTQVDWCNATFVDCFESSLTVHKERTPNPNLTLTPRLRVNLDAAKIADLAIIMKQMLR